MSDLENELLDLAGNGARGGKKSGGRRPKSSAYVDSESEGEEEIDQDAEDDAEEDDDEEEEDMDMDLDSDDDAPPKPRPSATGSKRKPVALLKNPYPLEGKYIDEDDRDQLAALPEIERENILAGRLEEMQKFKDSHNLDQMFRTIGGGASDDDDEDDEPRKRRKHTSMTAGATRAIKDLKNKRKAKEERASQRALKRKDRRLSNESAQSTESGEISERETYRRSRSPPKAAPKSMEKKDIDLDVTDPNCQELNSARLSRYEIVDILYKDGFEETAAGSMVRLIGGMDQQTGRPKYRAYKITGIEPDSGDGRYQIEYKGREVTEDRVLRVKYGKAERLFRIADVSNGDFEDVEFERMKMTYREDRVRIPLRSELKSKHEQIRELRDRAMTNEEIQRQIDARKRLNPSSVRNKQVIQITQLIASRALAVRRNDIKEADRIKEQLLALGVHPSTGQPLGEQDDEELIKAEEEKSRREKEEKKRKAVQTAQAIAALKRKTEEAKAKEKQQAGSGTASPAPGVSAKSTKPGDMFGNVQVTLSMDDF